MIETELSSKFVDETIREFGNKIWIQKQPNPLKCGTPDIYSSINGLFIPIECKHATKDGNSILHHPFKKIQLKRLRDLSINSFPIGLIFLNNEKRWIFHLDIRQDGNLSFEQYLSLPIFSWREVYNAATKVYQNRCDW